MTGPTLLVDGCLQDHDGGDLVDHLSVAATGPTGVVQRLVGADRGEALIDEPHRNRLACLCQCLSVLTCHGGSTPLRSGEVARQAHDKAHHLKFPGDLGDPSKLGRAVPRDRLHRGGQECVAVAAGQPNTDITDVHAQAYPHLDRTHRATTLLTSATMASSASGTAPASVPPPWATSSFPPPPPPRRPAAVRTSWPARTPAARAEGLTATTTEGRPPLVPATATTAGVESPSRPRTSRARVRRSSPPDTSPASWATTRVPCTSWAESAIAPTEPSSCWRRSMASSFSADLSRLIREEMRSGSSSGRAPRRLVT